MVYKDHIALYYTHKHMGNNKESACRHRRPPRIDPPDLGFLFLSLALAGAGRLAPPELPVEGVTVKKPSRRPCAAEPRVLSMRCTVLRTRASLLFKCQRWGH